VLQTKRMIHTTAIVIAVVLGLLAACTVPEPPPLEEPEVVQLDADPQTPTPSPEPEEPEPVDPLEVALAREVSSLELRDKVAGLLMVTIAGMDAERFRSFHNSTPVAGFLLLRTNLEGDASTVSSVLSRVQEGQEYPLLFGVDQEGSPIARIRSDDLPGARDLGDGPTDETTRVFGIRQEIVAESGANVNFGVVADLTPGPGAYIHNRAFGSDPALVSEHVVAALKAREPGVAQTIKHFPGHGLVFEDSHEEIPESTLGYDQWWESHALPFRAAMDHHVELVMMAHIRILTVSQDPASVSNDWIDILRNNLGYDGVIITDDLGMLESSGEDQYQDPAATAVAALVAGNDIIMLAVDPGDEDEVYALVVDAMVQAVADGLVSEEQVDASLMRVLRLRQSLISG
jgi:beta-N-acetylhexosaminidase